MNDFLHGAEVFERSKLATAYALARGAAIAILGTAPIGPVNTPTLLLSDSDAAQFGPALAGFTLPQALSDIYGTASATIAVINVLDPAVHKTTVADEVVAVGNDGRFQASQGGLLSLTVKSADGATTYVKDTHYRVDMVTGKLLRLPAATFALGASLKLSFDYADPSKVTSADVIGAVSLAGVRSGAEALRDVYGLYGFEPRFLLAPVYCTQTSVASELLAMADELDGLAFIDAPIGTTVAQTLAGRGPAGTINFNTASARAVLCYPHVKIQGELHPLSPLAAAAWVGKQNREGLGVSPSNERLARVEGLERPLTSRYGDVNAEVNQLNAAGIVTVFNDWGSGFRLWGNRSAAFPGDVSLLSFLCVRHSGDVFNEGLLRISLRYQDKPLTQALIDSLVESGNALVRQMISDGDLIGGKVWFDKARNPVSELGKGHLTLSYKYTPSLPLERLTHEVEVTDEFLLTFKGA